MSDKADEVMKAEQEYAAALAVVKKCVPGKPGFGNEAKYGQTYQQLVLLHARPQIKLKYRGR